MELVSHSPHQWSEQVCNQHESEKPFPPENGEPLKFKVGDEIIYTNDYGVEFKSKVTGFYKPKERCSLYARGYRYLLDKDSYWMPVKEENLRYSEND